MPQRFLRPGIVGSLRLARCSPWAQLLYYKLINLVDDYDRFDAHPMVLGRAAFPYGDPKGRAFKEEQIEAWLAELEKARLGTEDDPCITRYTVNGTRYLILHRCTERIRSMNSRYPSPEEDATCWQMLSDVVRCRQNPTNAASTPSSTPSSTPNGTERERYGGFASKEAAKGAQDNQYAAAKSELNALGKVRWEDLTATQQELVKKNRALLKDIRTKQKKGDFTPVEETK